MWATIKNIKAWKLFTKLWSTIKKHQQNEGVAADRNLDGKRGWRKGHLRKGSQAGSFLAETGLVSVEHQMQEIGLAPSQAEKTSEKNN
ncbi:hypothetical protein Tco_1508031 [Tanacetum coccineum]